MAALRSRRGASVAAVAAVAALVLAACGGGGDEGGARSPNADKPECAPYKDYQGFSGKKVSMYTSIRDIEADRHKQSWAQFEKCTGIRIQYEGSGEFEAQLNVKVQGGNAPDIAFFPQPGLLQRFARQGKLKEAPKEVEENVDNGWSQDWKNYGTYDGKFYAAPVGANVKSYVWYSPTFFKQNNFKVPQTWDEMMALTDQIAAKGVKPWCAGVESGDATGWPATDWMEDVMLRAEGTQTYDDWVEHKIPFNDPKVVAVADRVGSILKNPKYVNGGFGDVKSITTTSFQDGGTPILKNKCAMHRQASFYANQWPKGTKVAEDGQVFAFYFPPIDPSKGKPVLGGGEFAGAFTDRGEVKMVLRYLSSADWANTKAKLGEWISANKGLDLNNVASPVDKLSVQLLQDPNTVFRFDGSDLMPATVGAGTFWKGMVDWLNGKDTKTVLDQIEASWPQS